MSTETIAPPTAPTPSTTPSTPVDAPVDSKTTEVKPVMAPVTPPATPRPKPMVAVEEALKRAASKNAPAPKPAAEPEKPAEPLAKPDLTVPPEVADKPADDPSKPQDEPPAKDKAVGPWQLKEKWEKTAKTYERENAELRQKLASMGELETHKTRAEQAEARAKELEEAIRFVDYQKSQEFKDKYETPYVKAWERALNDLSQLSVAQEDGTERQAVQTDMLRLAQLPLGEARRQAKAMFGDSADDVMAHYRQIRELSDLQTQALDEAKKAGSEREKQTLEERTRTAAETQQLWQESLRTEEEKLEFLRDKEDDNEWNERLTKARELVDTAFAERADAPKLTREQRAEIVRKHAAVRNRAIGYSMMKLENTRLKAEIAARDEKLKQYASSEPSNGDGNGAGAQKSTSTNPMDRFEQAAKAMAARNR